MTCQSKNYGIRVTVKACVPFIHRVTVVIVSNLNSGKNLESRKFFDGQWRAIINSLRSNIKSSSLYQIPLHLYKAQRVAFSRVPKWWRSGSTLEKLLRCVQLRGFEQCGYIYSPESNRTVKFQSGILCGQFYQIVHIFVFMNGQWDRDRPRQLKYCDKYCIKAQQTA